MKMLKLVLFCCTVVLQWQYYHCFEPIVMNSRYANEEVALFKQWMVKHQRSYNSEDEHDYRLLKFVNNLQIINRHNSEQHGWEMGLNQFSDMDFEEFRSNILGDPQNCSATKTRSFFASNTPTRKDWREEGNYVTAIKNQGHCGSCWTFSTTGCLESATAIHKEGHPLYTLSEQQLVDCATAFDDFGCNGGLPSHAFEYIKYNKGLESEDDYPYDAKMGPCEFDPTLAKANVYDVVNITKDDEESIVNAVGTMNPVSVAFQVTPDFQHYKSGIYSNPKCGSLPSQVNHAVLAVGYDADVSGKPYWIIKNSWGTTFGIEGYFYMERGSNMCGVATCASYPIVVP
ncbi:pro-cathepsin H-like isoform X1 [Styela clava]